MEISAASPGPPKAANFMQWKAYLSGFMRRGFMPISNETYWSRIKIKDASPNGCVNNLSNFSKYLVVSPSKMPYSQGFWAIAQNVLEGSPSFT